MARYTAFVDGQEGSFGVFVPDLPGCTAMGATLEEALRNAVDAVRDWVEVTEEAGGDVPAPRPIEAIRDDPEIAEALAGGATLTHVPLIREIAPRRL